MRNERGKSYLIENDKLFDTSGSFESGELEEVKIIRAELVASQANEAKKLDELQSDIDALDEKIKALEEENKARKVEIEAERKARKEEFERLSARLKTGDNNFKELENTQKITLRCLQALIRHSLGIDDPGALKTMMKELDDFLTEK